MRLLTLVRHAKSSWDDPELGDFERPLNARGRRDAPLMAERAAANLPLPDLLLSSPALRAISTAHVFADGLGVDRHEIRIEPKIYEAVPAMMLRIIAALDGAQGHVMLFGHNPGISRCARLLAECPFDEMPTCGVVSIALRVDDWRDIAPSKGRLKRYDYPKKSV